jgi:hypothetical protein
MLDLRYCALTGNVANSHGGGILITERSTSESSQIFNCTFSGNNSSGGAGGGVCVNSAAAVVINCTFSGNTAINGGALFTGINSSSAISPQVVIESCTLNGNTATRGGGISTAYGQGVFLDNDIFNNSSGGNLHTFSGAPLSGGHNLASDNGGGFLTAAGDIINTNPMLGPLASNGGATQTHALLPGSPAINAGQPGQPGDQRGYPRVGTTDIGAFEFDSFALRIIAIRRLIDGSIQLDGKGVVNSTFSVRVSPDLMTGSFGLLGPATSDNFGDWHYIDSTVSGLTKRFYQATFP